MTAVIPYGASAESTTATVREVLAKHGHRVITTWDVDDPDGEPAVWVIPAGQTTGRGEYFRPGQRLTVGDDGSYRIEGASAVAA